MKTEIILVLAAAQVAFGVIYRLNETEYERMPPLYKLDDFNGCLREPGGKYCYFEGEILDDGSDLNTLIKEYSASVLTHFNHSLIHWGLCVTQTCRQYYGNSTLEDALDACINATLYESHQLQAKLIREEKLYCTDFGETEPYDTSDFVVGAVFVTLVLLNVFGTVYDLSFHDKQRGFLSKFFLCFSLRRSWRKLVMTSGEGPEPKLKTLNCLNGIKAISTALVLLGHSPLTGFVAIDNPHYQEESYHTIFFQMLLNGTLVVQTFFTVSGFLLSYNILVLLEKKRIGWQTLPQTVLLRWLRLTPVYAVILAFVATWLRHFSSGPLWKPVVNSEILDCRRDWWLHVLYIDNYVDLSHCMPQSWYISGDMQLSILGLAIFCLCRTARSRKIAILITFVIGLLAPATHTFFQNLHPVLIVSPEMARNFFVQDATFNNLYKRGHTNLVCYAMGLALGMVMYDMYGQEIKDKKKNRMWYMAACPVGLGCVLIGIMFYVDGLVIPLMVRVVYSSAIKMVFGACVCAVIAGCLMKLDSVIRSILEWQGWTPLNRVSYCAYLLHVCLIRTSFATFTTLQHVSLYRIILNYCGIVGVTYTLAVPCWLLVEMPICQFIKLCQTGGRTRKEPDVTVKAAPPQWKDQELSSSVETVVVKT